MTPLDVLILVVFVAYVGTILAGSSFRSRLRVGYHGAPNASHHVDADFQAHANADMEATRVDAPRPPRHAAQPRRQRDPSFPDAERLAHAHSRVGESDGDMEHHYERDEDSKLNED